MAAINAGLVARDAQLVADNIRTRFRSPKNGRSSGGWLRQLVSEPDNVDQDQFTARDLNRPSIRADFR